MTTLKSIMVNSTEILLKGQQDLQKLCSSDVGPGTYKIKMMSSSAHI